MDITQDVLCAIEELSIDFNLKTFQRDAVSFHAAGADCLCVAPNGAGKKLGFLPGSICARVRSKCGQNNKVEFENQCFDCAAIKVAR